MRYLFTVTGTNSKSIQSDLNNTVIFSQTACKDLKLD